MSVLAQQKAEEKSRSTNVRIQDLADVKEFTVEPKKVDVDNCSSAANAGIFEDDQAEMQEQMEAMIKQAKRMAEIEAAAQWSEDQHSEWTGAEESEIS